MQGAAVFTLGQLLQHSSHNILANLSKPRSSVGATAMELPASHQTTATSGAENTSTGGTGASSVQQQPTKSCSGAAQLAKQRPGARSIYRVPTSGGFRWVSSPHYLGEIIIYVGLVIVCRGRAMTLLVLAWVVRDASLPNCPSVEVFPFAWVVCDTSWSNCPSTEDFRICTVHVHHPQEAMLSTGASVLLCNLIVRQWSSCSLGWGLRHNASEFHIWHGQ
jgi:hypothetical protein